MASHRLTNTSPPSQYPSPVASPSLAHSNDVLYSPVFDLRRLAFSSSFPSSLDGEFALAIDALQALIIDKCACVLETSDRSQAAANCLALFSIARRVRSSVLLDRFEGPLRAHAATLAIRAMANNTIAPATVIADIKCERRRGHLRLVEYLLPSLCCSSLSHLLRLLVAAALALGRNKKDKQKAERVINTAAFVMSLLVRRGCCGDVSCDHHLFAVFYWCWALALFADQQWAKARESAGKAINHAQIASDHHSPLIGGDLICATLFRLSCDFYCLGVCAFDRCDFDTAADFASLSSRAKQSDRTAKLLALSLAHSGRVDAALEALRSSSSCDLSGLLLELQLMAKQQQAQRNNKRIRELATAMAAHEQLTEALAVAAYDVVVETECEETDLRHLVVRSRSQQAIDKAGEVVRARPSGQAMESACEQMWWIINELARRRQLAPALAWLHQYAALSQHSDPARAAQAHRTEALIRLELQQIDKAILSAELSQAAAADEGRSPLALIDYAIASVIKVRAWQRSGQPERYRGELERLREINELTDEDAVDALSLRHPLAGRLSEWASVYVDCLCLISDVVLAADDADDIAIEGLVLEELLNMLHRHPNTRAVAQSPHELSNAAPRLSPMFLIGRLFENYVHRARQIAKQTNKHEKAGKSSRNDNRALSVQPAGGDGDRVVSDSELGGLAAGLFNCADRIVQWTADAEANLVANEGQVSEQDYADYYSYFSSFAVLLFDAARSLSSPLLSRFSEAAQIFQAAARAFKLSELIHTARNDKQRQTNGEGAAASCAHHRQACVLYACASRLEGILISVATGADKQTQANDDDGDDEERAADADSIDAMLESCKNELDELTSFTGAHSLLLAAAPSVLATLAFQVSALVLTRAVASGRLSAGECERTVEQQFRELTGLAALSHAQNETLAAFAVALRLYALAEQASRQALEQLFKQGPPGAPMVAANFRQRVSILVERRQRCGPHDEAAVDEADQRLLRLFDELIDLIEALDRDWPEQRFLAHYPLDEKKWLVAVCWNLGVAALKQAIDSRAAALAGRADQFLGESIRLHQRLISAGAKDEEDKRRMAEQRKTMEQARKHANRLSIARHERNNE